MAIALAVSGLATDAAAQGRGRAERMAQERDGGVSDDSAGNGMAIRSQRVQEANAARAARRAEQREGQAERGAARGSEQVAQQDSWQGSRQAGRRGDQTPRQVEQRGEQAARQAEQQQQWRAEQVQRAERNRTYADQGRQRDYSANDGARRGNDTWQGQPRADNTWQGDRRADNTWRSDNRHDNDRRWDRSWRNSDRYDWQRYRNNHRSVYSLGAYAAPYRYYSYRRFGVGTYMNSLFFGSSYWITNPWQYRLPDVWGPYRWVRYYDDVMLVDVYTGQVVDVIYNFFW